MDEWTFQAPPTSAATKLVSHQNQQNLLRPEFREFMQILVGYKKYHVLYLPLTVKGWLRLAVTCGDPRQDKPRVDLMSKEDEGVRLHSGRVVMMAENEQERESAGSVETGVTREATAIPGDPSTYFMVISLAP